ncbi:MAG: glycosyltransferase [Candidatus Komeilibacteria bacterium]|nr:glycosyltransferase [Candidatus Komeilibacteria bacterium]
MNKKLNLVIFGMNSYEAWQSGVENRNFQVLEELTKRPEIEKILFLDYLPWTWKQAAKMLLGIIRSRLRFEHHNHYPAWSGRLKQISEKLLVYTDAGYFLNRARFYQRLKKIIAQKLGDNYSLWSYYPVDLGYLTELQPELVIFDLVDNWAEHPSYQKIKKQLLANYTNLIKQADLVFTVAEHFKNWLGDEPNIYWIPNGVRTEKFTEPTKLINKDLATIPEPRVIYVGTIQKRIDFELLEYLLAQHPQKSFIFIGPAWPNYWYWRFFPNNPHRTIVDLQKKYHNLHWLGRKPYPEVPAYLHQSKVAIVPHISNEFIQYTDSMKIYEYLAAGLPVVTTPSPNLEQFSNFIHLAKTAPEFSRALDQALAENNPVNNLHRQTLTENHHWSKRVEIMIQLIEKKITER